MFARKQRQPNRRSRGDHLASCISQNMLYAVRPTLYEIQSTNSYVRNYNKIMQNKAKLRKSQMNVNKVLTKDYEKRHLANAGKTNPNKAKTKPNKPNFKANKAIPAFDEWGPLCNYRRNFKWNPAGCRCYYVEVSIWLRTI